MGKHEGANPGEDAPIVFNKALGAIRRQQICITGAKPSDLTLVLKPPAIDELVSIASRQVGKIA